ncbi:MAG: SRPBCC domain-containing protein [Gemmatimonadetes bacterium]|nr:SRPBCC domain-containing protein [Gemmatimonadota bacterium]
MDIEHEFVVAAPIEEVFACFSTGPGLAAWWTDTSTADPRRGGRYTFGFDPEHQWAGVVRVYDAPHAIEWEMTETAPMDDWHGTRVGARLASEGDNTRLHFYHRGWEGKTAHQRISSFCWAMYLRLLARYCTTGEVVPYARRNDL